MTDGARPSDKKKPKTAPPKKKAPPKKPAPKDEPKVEDLARAAMTIKGELKNIFGLDIDPNAEKYEDMVKSVLKFVDMLRGKKKKG